jgi:hypothetical protein
MTCGGLLLAVLFCTGCTHKNYASLLGNLDPEFSSPVKLTLGGRVIGAITPKQTSFAFVPQPGDPKDSAGNLLFMLDLSTPCGLQQLPAKAPKFEGSDRTVYELTDAREKMHIVHVYYDNREGRGPATLNIGQLHFILPVGKGSINFTAGGCKGTPGVQLDDASIGPISFVDADLYFVTRLPGRCYQFQTLNYSWHGVAPSEGPELLQGKQLYPLQPENWEISYLLEVPPNSVKSAHDFVAHALTDVECPAPAATDSMPRAAKKAVSEKP